MESTLPVVDSGVNRISASVSKSYHSVRFPTQLQSELLSRKLHTLQLSRTEPNRTTNSTLIAHNNTYYNMTNCHIHLLDPVDDRIRVLSCLPVEGLDAV